MNDTLLGTLCSRTLCRVWMLLTQNIRTFGLAFRKHWLAFGANDKGEGLSSLQRSIDSVKGNWVVAIAY